MIRVMVAACGFVLLAGSAAAQSADPPPAPQQRQPDQTFAVHGQATFVVQGVGGFASPYAGANSLTPRQVRETLDVTAYVGVRLWDGAELWADPEIDQGFGLSDTLGVAGFPSAEAYKVGRSSPYARLQRLFVRQTIALGGPRQAVAAAANQLGGMVDADRLVVTAGKFGVGDVFDTNGYAHDPRGDFLNWSAVDAGSFDYAADAWGYTTGIAAEAYRGAWTLRLGAFNLSKVPNGETLERDFSQYQLDAEIEHRHILAGQPGAIRVTLFRNRGRFSRFDDALALAAATGAPVDPAPTRRPMTRLGVHFNLEQQAGAALGLFARAGIADGAIEPYDFTDIDRSAAIGGVLHGVAWRRPGDRIGLALIANGISAAHRRFLAAGGLGVLVGDGRLPDAAAEQIVEVFYAMVVGGRLEATIDAQHIANPGYNRDRGPADILALRLHAGF